MPRAPAGPLAVPMTLLLASVALAATGGRAPARDASPRVELELAGVLPLPDAPAGILVLREKGKEVLLPLLVPDGRSFVPGAESGALLGRAIEALGAKVSEVEIERPEESTAGARVRLAQGSKQVEIRAVPSESIALAVAASVPIVTSRRLLDEEGLTPEDLSRAHARRGQGTSRL